MNRRFGPFERKLALSLFLLASSFAHGKPGNEGLLLEKVLPGRVYAVESFTNPRGFVTGLRLAWIPKDIEQGCMGKSFKECQELDHCHVWREQSDSCKALGLDPSKIKPRAAHAIPSRVLDFVIEIKKSSLPKHLLKKVKVPWTKDMGLTHSLDPLSREKSAQMQLRYQLWTNGENVSLAGTPPPSKKEGRR